MTNERQARDELTRAGRLVSNELTTGLHAEHDRHVANLVSEFVATYLAQFRIGLLDPRELRKLRNGDEVIEWQQRRNAILEKRIERADRN